MCKGVVVISDLLLYLVHHLGEGKHLAEIVDEVMGMAVEVVVVMVKKVMVSFQEGKEKVHKLVRL